MLAVAGNASKYVRRMINREQGRDRASSIFRTMREDDPVNALPGDDSPMNDDKIDTKEHPVIALEAQ